MADNIDPNKTLAKEIVQALSAKGLILDQNADDLNTFLGEGKMKDNAWKKVLENKITSIIATDED